MPLPTPGVTPANWGAQLNAEITAAAFPASGGTGRYILIPGDAITSNAVTANIQAS